MSILFLFPPINNKFNRNIEISYYLYLENKLFRKELENEFDTHHRCRDISH